MSFDYDAYFRLLGQITLFVGASWSGVYILVVAFKWLRDAHRAPKRITCLAKRVSELEDRYADGEWRIKKLGEGLVKDLKKPAQPKRRR